MRRCESTPMPASSCAPVPPAAWLTRFVMTSRCCWSKRPGGRERQRERRPRRLGRSGLRPSRGPARYARRDRGGGSCGHATAGRLGGGPSADRAAAVRGDRPVGLRAGRQAARHRRGGHGQFGPGGRDAQRHDRAQQPGPGGALPGRAAAGLGRRGRHGHRGVLLGQYPGDTGHRGRGGQARLPASRRRHRRIPAAPDRRAGPRAVRPGGSGRPARGGTGPLPQAARPAGSSPRSWRCRGRCCGRWPSRCW